MKMRIIAVGKIKEPFYEAAVGEYSKRLGRYCKLEIVQVADERTPDGAGPALEAAIRRKEGDRILACLREQDYVIALDMRGEMQSSEQLAKKLEVLAIGGNSQVAFLIGGSLGLTEEVLQRADYRLSFSKMTFPHQLMRVILLEQVYRSYRIIHREPYHK